MCVVGSSANIVDTVFGIVGGASNLANKVSSYKANKTNYEYQTQLALNNARMAQEMGLTQKQLGIEKSRLEKIESLQKISKIKAQNSASGLDSMSGTNKLVYDDVAYANEINAQAIKNSYDISAKSYFNQANNYLNQANNYKELYKKSLFNQSMNALGQFGKVASSWYENME